MTRPKQKYYNTPRDEVKGLGTRTASSHRSAQKFFEGVTLTCGIPPGAMGHHWLVKGRSVAAVSKLYGRNGKPLFQVTVVAQEVGATVALEHGHLGKCFKTCPEALGYVTRLTGRFREEAGE